MSSFKTTLSLFTLLLFVAIFGFGIFSEGMFFDGIRYANVARNYAEGFGTFWNLYYGTSEYTHYHDQPPLTFFLQSIFFKFFGPSIYTERIYDAVLAVFHILLIIKLWKELAGNSTKLYWLPALFWILIPLTSWTFKNNLQEATMGAFDLAAVILLLKGYKRRQFMYLLAGGICTVLASLCKGLQGLFPVVIPFLYWIIYRERSFSQMIIFSLMAIGVIALSYTYFYFTPEIRESIGLYFKQRLESTFSHDHDTQTNHFYLLGRLLLELIPPVFLTGLLWVLGRKRKHADFDMKPITLMFLVGLSASLPLMVTLEQRPFYLTTSLPYFAMTLALMAAPFIMHHLDKVEEKNYSTLNILLTSVVVIISLMVVLNSPNAKRDHDLVHDLYVIRESIPENSNVSVHNTLSDNWAYHAYFMRYGKITLDPINANTFYITDDQTLVPADTCYKKMELHLKRFSVFQCLLR